MNKYIIGGFLLLFLGGAFSFAHFSYEAKGNYNTDSSKKINLAIRQMAHHLYVSEGNDSSRILPVKQLSDYEYKLKLDNPINYDTLPFLLDNAFRDYEIQAPYFVSIYSCESDSILLGYNFLSFMNKEIPCLGREQLNPCNIISITFEKNMTKTGYYLPFAFLSFGFGIFGLLLGRRAKSASKTKSSSLHTENHTIKIGSSIFTPQSLMIKIREDEKVLTFREAKLLEYFASHPNEVLNREQIQDYVWKDEGVIVGRSLDVFISRLRKILKSDESISIKNIHGVGYKLEVK